MTPLFLGIPTIGFQKLDCTLVLNRVGTYPFINCICCPATIIDHVTVSDWKPPIPKCAKRAHWHALEGPPERKSPSKSVETPNKSEMSFATVSNSNKKYDSQRTNISNQLHDKSVMQLISRLLKITGLFCKRALWKRRYSANETYNLKEPTNSCCVPWLWAIKSVGEREALMEGVGQSQKHVPADTGQISTWADTPVPSNQRASLIGMWGIGSCMTHILSDNHIDSENLQKSLFSSCSELFNSLFPACYRVAKTHRIPYLYRSFSAKEPYI